MITFRVAETRHDHGLCVAIRTLVFEVEQGVDIAIEVDVNEDTCRHILGLDDARPFAAARWRHYGPGVAKIERVAVLKPWRGRDLGTALVQAVIADIKDADAGCNTLRLEAQDYTIPFYAKMGFIVVSEGFLDANIPHHAMERPVDEVR
jgi:predicted GNAT family N-acyltransferase